MLTCLSVQASNDIFGANAQVINSDAEQLYTLLVCECFPEGAHCGHPLLRWEKDLPAILLQSVRTLQNMRPLHNPWLVNTA